MKLSKDADWGEIRELAAFSHDLVVRNNLKKEGKSS